MTSTALVPYIPQVATRLDNLVIWNKPVASPNWADDAWAMVKGVVAGGGGSSWKKYVDEFLQKEWATDFGKRQAALTVRRFFNTAASKEMNPQWSGDSEVSLLNDAAHHETSTMVKNIANRFFYDLRDFDSGLVQGVGQGGAPELTPGDGKGLLVKAGQTAVAALSGDELELRGQLISLGKTELGPLLHQAFKKLPHSDWMKAIDKEWDIQDANFRVGERVVTQNGRLAVVAKQHFFKPDVVTITLAETGHTVDVAASLLNRSFKRGEWTWTARFEPIAGKVVKSIGLITRIQKLNTFYQVRKLSDGISDLYLAKHMMPMALKYQAVLNSTPMVMDFKTATLFDQRVKLNPCNIQAKMENSLAMHEGREQYDNALTRQLVKEGNANQKEAAIAAGAQEAGEYGYFGLPQEPGEELPWQYPRAQRMVGVSRTGQSWLSWLSGAEEFPLAIKEKRRRVLEAANVEGRRRRLPTQSEESEAQNILEARTHSRSPERTATHEANKPPLARTSRSESLARKIDFTSGESTQIIASQQVREASAARPPETPRLDVGPVESSSSSPSPLVVIFIALLLICLMWAA